tara:strand:+ start:8759 stop:10366 length:1608 start_codon:yes stop_codon:yes gene_type:complete
MATPNIVPRADQEGGLGTSAKSWGKLFIENPTAGGTAAATISNLDVDQVALDINANNTTANIIDITSTTLTTGKAANIDIVDSGTATANNILFELDYTKSGVIASSATRTVTGFNLEMTDSATNNASGSVVMTGQVIQLTNSSGQGTITQTGLIVQATGGDADKTHGIIITTEDGGVDLSIRSSADTGDKFTIATSTAGSTTISTIDDDATAAHLKFVIDGDMYIDPAGLDTWMGADDNTVAKIKRLSHSDGPGGGLELQGGSATAGQTDDAGGTLFLSGGESTGNAVPGGITFRGALKGSSGTSLNSNNTIANLRCSITGDDATVLQMYEAGGASSLDYFVIEVFEHGFTKLRTVDTAAAAAHIELESDGAITLDASAAIVFEQGANSAALMECSGRVMIQQTFMKIMPDRFFPNGDSGRSFFVADQQTNKLGIHQYDSSDELYAHIEIPFGHTVTHVHVYTSATVSSGVTIGAYNYNTGADNAVTTTSGDTNTDISLGVNSIAGGAAQDLWIKVALASNLVWLWGAKVTLSVT